MFRQFLLVLFVLLSPPLTVYAAGPVAGDDPWLLLEKASQAAHQLSYKGIFVYQAGRTVNSMRITHMNYPQGEFSRVISLDGAPREMLRQGNDVVIYKSQDQKVVIDRRRAPSAFPALLPGAAALKASYQVRLAGQERIGEREGTVVSLDPRDRYRYGYRFSVDRQSGLLLKSVMLNERNEIVEQVAFNQLSLLTGAEDMDWFRPDIDRAKTYVMGPEDTVTPIAAEGEGWTLTQLPAGYRKIEHVKRDIPGKPVPINHLVFSDGLSSVSLFIELLDKSSKPKLGHMVQGATNLYAITADGYQIIVVGEVPEATVRLIAGAVSFKK